ncbi:rhodanese-like domain-containing protein [Pseudonocardia zijingensis]|uniref:Rhodanese-like domain-containing protein n=1 Tax=Pseudonocardia zijingensis TaxID=153376 RepID=A0ABN1P3T4_9PSEU
MSTPTASSSSTADHPASGNPAPVGAAREHTVDPQTLRAWMDAPEQLTVIDVRSPAEFETVHIHGSYNVPLPLLGEHAAQVADRIDHRTVLVCQSGVRAADARRRLAAVGMGDLHVLGGGVPAFERVGGEVVRGRARWALERQVRLVAGGLVTAGVLGSLWKRPLVALAGAIGAGLTVSALTDTCAMGRLLSALPYNRAGGALDPALTLDALPRAGS